jgi:hypothetical protein
VKGFCPVEKGCGGFQIGRVIIAVGDDDGVLARVGQDMKILRGVAGLQR